MLKELENVCKEKGIRVETVDMNSEFLIYHEEQKLVMIDSSINSRDIKRFIDFIS